MATWATVAAVRTSAVRTVAVRTAAMASHAVMPAADVVAVAGHPHPPPELPTPPQLDEAASTRRAQRWPRRCAASTARRASSRRVDVELLGLEVCRPVDSASDPRGSDPASDCAKTGHSRSVTCLGGQHVQRRGRWCVEKGLLVCRTCGRSRPKPKLPPLSAPSSSSWSPSSC